MMNIGLMIVTAVITTVGLICITEYYGRKAARSVNKILAFMTIAPFMVIIVKLLIVTTNNPDSTSAAGNEAIETMMEMLPETIISVIIGDAIGFILWGIYRWVKRFF